MAFSKALTLTLVRPTFVFSFALGFCTVLSPALNAQESKPRTRAPELPTEAPPRYETRAAHDPNGIGKFYCGREIAQVMGHEAADWLERPEREEEERPSVLLATLQLKPGMTVADIGAGSGYMSWRMAQQVQPNGRVYAVDVQPEMLQLLSRRAAEKKITNITPVLGTSTNVNLPAESIDLALLVDVYHEFSFPWEMMQSICAALRRGGKLVFVEYRAEDPQVPIKAVHKMTEAQVRLEMKPWPLEWVETRSELPRQHIIIFRRR
jgi:precorrin-6B methylase 2